MCYVPNIKQNTISIGKLVQKRDKVYFENNACKILDTNGRILCKSPYRTKQDILVNVEKWFFCYFEGGPERSGMVMPHLRFGHLSFNSLNLLHRKNMVNSFPLIEKPNKFCEGCILGK